MWTVVYIAPSVSLAEQLKDRLSKEGLLVTLRAVGAVSLEDAKAIEVLVPETEAEEASEIINEYF